MSFQFTASLLEDSEARLPKIRSALLGLLESNSRKFCTMVVLLIFNICLNDVG